MRHQHVEQHAHRSVSAVGAEQQVVRPLEQLAAPPAVVGEAAGVDDVYVGAEVDNEQSGRNVIHALAVPDVRVERGARLQGVAQQRLPGALRLLE